MMVPYIGRAYFYGEALNPKPQGITMENPKPETACFLDLPGAARAQILSRLQGQVGYQSLGFGSEFSNLRFFFSSRGLGFKV